MKRILTAILLLNITFSLYAQKVDTILTTDIYKSYFSYKYKLPLYVSYRLYKGGGNCGRKSDNFKNTRMIDMATAKDFAGSGFDQGHMASAEDFAYDCIKQEATFRFENLLPQYPNLNRGIWKSGENDVREMSQTDSLKIIAGGKFGKKTFGKKVGIPNYCFKIVISLTTNQVTHVYWYTNKVKDNIMQEITIEALFDKKHLGYVIDLEKI